MNPDNQFIAIAKAVGWILRWQNIGGGELYDKKPNRYSWSVWFHPDHFKFKDATFPPDYLNDLNAMHEATSYCIKDAEGQFLFAAHLLKLNRQGWLLDEGDLNVDHCWICARSTAAQRAEAFLKTLNLWEEE